MRKRAYAEICDRVAHGTQQRHDSFGHASSRAGRDSEAAHDVAGATSAELQETISRAIP